jgi:pimeloyl-ACP methyl ester carboxylesterase
MKRLLLLIIFTSSAFTQRPFYDKTYYSKIFAQARNYRIFLPPDYASSGKRYPVIYYFHGHSDRYTLEDYDHGLDTVPKIEAFVSTHDVIVVAVDGYVARDYTGFYGGSPYDVRRDGGDYDFGGNLKEIVAHVDSTYRTLTSRRFRATSGLSMGGFMSLYLSARYPELIGSASAFNPGPEFFIGEKGRRSLWRPKDHVLNHEHTMIRLVRASGDFISQYTEETRNAYAIAPAVDFEYRQDEYHRHWATSIAETFAFHMRAFANPALDTVPTDWNYDSAYRAFSVWGYRVEADVAEPAIISLDHVSQGGLRISTRRWAPDGPPAVCSAITLITAPLYRAGGEYQVSDYGLASGTSKQTRMRADRDGRLTLRVDCSGHELSFAGPGAGGQAPVLLPVTGKDVLRLMPGKLLFLPIRLYNPRSVPMENVHVDLSSEYATIDVVKPSAELKRIAPGAIADLSSAFQVRLTGGDGDFAHARLKLKFIYDGYSEVAGNIDILIAPDRMPPPLEVAVLDGRTKTFSVFRQKGNQGGGSSIQRTVTEGKGNGNGTLEPGEQATIWVKLAQGLDPFDKNNWCRAKIYTESSWFTEAGDIEEEKQREWTGAQSRTSLMDLKAGVPAGTEIPVILDCESWSFSFTPDVRYGKEPLYQAFQLHRHNQFFWTLKVTVKNAPLWSRLSSGTETRAPASGTTESHGQRPGIATLARKLETVTE